jgi:hypothetical protein
MNDLDGLKNLRRKAPATLLPRVLAAVAAEQARPWHQRPWWTWPLAGQAAYGLAVAGAAALVLRGGMQAAAPAHAALARAQAAAEAAGVVVGALWKLGGQPLRLLTVLMAGSCAAFGAGLARLLEPARRTI